MALVNFKKGLLASLPSTYTEGTFYVTTDERAIYLDVANDKRIRLGDFQEFASLAALEANDNPSTSALYYITDGNILAKWDGEKYVQINVQKTLEELGGVSKDTFDKVIYDQGEGDAKVKGLISKVADLEATVDGIVSVGGEANVIETVKVNGTELTVTDKAVDITVPTGALASKDVVAKTDLATELSTEIDNKVVKEDGKSLVLDTEIAKLVSVSEGANKVEASETNGYIKIDGTETKVYDETALAGRVTTAEGKITSLETESAKHAIKTEVETALTGKVDKVEGKSLIADSEVTRLAAMSDGANKVEASETNGNIKIDGVETVVYTHPEKHTITEVDGLEAVLNNKLEAADIANFETKENVKKVSDDLAAYVTSNDEALAGVRTIAEGKTTAAEVKTQIEAYGYATEADLTTAEGRITDAEANITELQKIKVTETSVTDGTNTFTKYDDTALAARVKTLEDNPYVLPDNVVVDTDLTVYRTSADQDIIDNEIKGRIDVVEGILNDKTEGDVTTKGLVSRVVDLESIDHDQLAKDASAAAVATVLDGAPEKFDTLKEIAAWIAEADTAEDAASLVTRVATIESDYLKEADKTALQAEIDADVKVVSDALAGHVATDHNFAAADAALKAELQSEIDADVKVVNDAFEAYKTTNDTAVALKANSADVYAKTETYTQEEVNAAIATAVETALTWGEF